MIIIVIDVSPGIYFVGMCNYGYIAERLLPDVSVLDTGSDGSTLYDQLVLTVSHGNPFNSKHLTIKNNKHQLL